MSDDDHLLYLPCGCDAPPPPLIVDAADLALVIGFARSTVGAGEQVVAAAKRLQETALANFAARVRYDAARHGEEG